MLPTEIEVPSVRLALAYGIGYTTSKISRIESTRWMKGFCSRQHNTIPTPSCASVYYKLVRPRMFSSGDLVLKALWSSHERSSHNKIHSELGRPICHWWYQGKWIFLLIDLNSAITLPRTNIKHRIYIYILCLVWIRIGGGDISFLWTSLACIKCALKEIFIDINSQDWVSCYLHTYAHVYIHMYTSKYG